jgi:hypothetical protein
VLYYDALTRLYPGFQIFKTIIFLPVFWIRIRIRNADPDPDPGGLKRAKMKKKRSKKPDN